MHLIDEMFWQWGAIHKMAATLGDSPTARALRMWGNFPSHRSLPHLAKHFYLGFLFLLWAKKHHTNQSLFRSTLPSRHNADVCFHRVNLQRYACAFWRSWAPR